jgi:hypothetical protein
VKAAFVLAALLLAAPQQQTFYSAKAEPKPVPAHTAQPLNPNYLLYLHCGGGRGGRAGKASGSSDRRSGATAHNGRAAAGRQDNCNSARPNARPSLAPAAKPAPRHS